MNKKRISIKQTYQMDTPCLVNLDDFIKELNRVKGELLRMNADCDKQVIYIDVDEQCEWGDHYAVLNMEFDGSRMETDKELKLREMRSSVAKRGAARRKADKEVEEKLLYDKLKAKYEGK